MDVDKTIKELSHNEKKVLLTLKRLNRKGSPEDILKNGDFNQEVEVMNASSWLQSKRLVSIEEHMKTVYSLGKEGKRFLEKGLPEKRALKLIYEKKGKTILKELAVSLEKNEIPIAIGWLKKNDWVNIRKDKETFLEITEKGKKALTKESDDEKIIQLLKKNDNIEIGKNKINSLLSRKNVIKEKDIITSTILLTENGKKALEKGFEIKDEISQVTSSIIKNNKWKMGINKDILPHRIFPGCPARAVVSQDRAVLADSEDSVVAGSPDLVEHVAGIARHGAPSGAVVVQDHTGLVLGIEFEGSRVAGLHGAGLGLQYRFPRSVREKLLNRVGREHVDRSFADFQ